MKRSRFTLGPRLEASPVSPKRKLQTYQSISPSPTKRQNTKEQTSVPQKKEPTERQIEREIKLGNEEEEEEEEFEEPIPEYTENKSRHQLQIEYNSVLNERDTLLNQLSRLIETQMDEQ
ncbi:hypothetical protein M9Y10_029179 [Tritrichomonas musculus]|uniref:Uncharacterized protein n=1 Tax=Tritrichomonas musculus TaxID=1915356 RepID=A0ABR2KM06_9EUKA